MKKTLQLLSFIFLVAGLGNKVTAQSQEDMKKWMAYMTPGEMHKNIASFDGQWNEEITMWMDPSQPPMKSTGTATNRMIMGGRYQQTQYNGTFNGMPFEGQGILGYDNAKKVFVSSWVDNMGTGMMYLEGPYDPATKTIVLRGNSVDPITGKDMPVRETMRMIDDKNHVMEMYMMQKGKEIKTMEIKFKRA